MIVNNLISAVSSALFDEFGDNYTIYAESVEQGLDEPCFFIQCLNSSLDGQFDSQFLMRNLFCVQYFPKDRLHPANECRAVSERLFLCLEYVKLDGEPVRSSKKNWEIHEGVLSFFLNFDTFVKAEESKKTQPVMKNLDKIILEEKHYEKHRS